MVFSFYLNISSIYLNKFDLLTKYLQSLSRFISLQYSYSIVGPKKFTIFDFVILHLAQNSKLSNLQCLQFLQ